MNVLRVTRHRRAARANPIDQDDARHLFEQLTEAGVPIELSVPFLIRAMGGKIQDFCRDIGIHRGYLHALLQGHYAVSLDTRFRVRNRLGFDPWYLEAPGRRKHEGRIGIPQPARPPVAAPVTGH